MKSILVFATIIFATLACSSSSSVELKPTHNDGRYTIQTYKRNATQDIVLSGYIRGLEEKDPLVLGFARSACSQVQVDTTGFYMFREKDSLSREVFLESYAIGYRELETEHFLVNRGDSVVIDFFLAYDDRPIIHCETARFKESQ